MKNIIGIVLIIVLCAIYYSCKDNSTQPTSEFEGITERSANGDLTGNVDPDDWQPLMICPGLPKSNTSAVTNPSTPLCTTIYPAYPNPTANSFTVQYYLHEADSVYMTMNDSPTHIVREMVKQRQAAGTFSVTVDASDLNSGMYRVYILVFRSTDVLHSYGDIKISK